MKSLTWLAILLIVFIAPVFACEQYIFLAVISLCGGLLILAYQMAIGQLKLFG